jgi:hypothetical protein
MRVTTGRVVNGKIEVPDEEFAEGMVVTILAPEDSVTFTLGPWPPQPALGGCLWGF